MALFQAAQRGPSEALFKLYSWFLPLLRLDVVPKFVQMIKLTQAAVGMGTARAAASAGIGGRRTARYPGGDSNRPGSTGNRAPVSLAGRASDDPHSPSLAHPANSAQAAWKSTHGRCWAIR